VTGDATPEPFVGSASQRLVAATSYDSCVGVLGDS
jgi:hypothetical protein